MGIDTIRAIYSVGDYVRVTDGEYKSLVGWIVRFVKDELCIYNAQASKEVPLAAFCLNA